MDVGSSPKNGSLDFSEIPNHVNESQPDVVELLKCKEKLNIFYLFFT